MKLAAIHLDLNRFCLHMGLQDGDAIRIADNTCESFQPEHSLDENGNLTERSQRQALDVLSRFREKISNQSPEAVRVVASGVLGAAKNAASFLSRAEKKIGCPIEVLSEKEERRLSYQGIAAALSLKEERCLVVDIQDRSTSLALGKGREIQSIESFGIGTIKQGLAFFSGSHLHGASIDAAILSSRSHLEDGAGLFRLRHGKAVCSSSGILCRIAEVIAKNAVGDGKLNYRSLEDLRKRLGGFGNILDADLDGLCRENLAEFLAGMAILMALMKEVGFEQIDTLEAGLQLGVLWDLRLRIEPQDCKEQAILNLAKRFHVSLQRSAATAELALEIYEQLAPNSHVYHECLRWSALLHEIGLAISHDGYHRHGAYLLEYASIEGFSAKERGLIGKLILAHKGNLRKIEGMLANPDFAKAVLALRLAVMCTHLQLGFGVKKVQIKMGSRIVLEADPAWLGAHPSLDACLSKEVGCWEEVGMPFAIRSLRRTDPSLLALPESLGAAAG